jgi:hypothetical protein
MAYPSPCAGPRNGPACRAGQGVAVLLKVYAPASTGEADAANKRITDVRDTSATEFGPATGEMMTVRRRP